MTSFPPGTDISLTIPFQDGAGSAIVPTGASYVVFDELENVVVPAATKTFTTETALVVTVPAAANQLPPPVTLNVNGEMAGVPIVSTTGLRAIAVVFATARGPVHVTSRYFLAQDKRLYLMQNTFQPYNQALLVATEIPNLMGWNASGVTDDQRIAALIEAWARLTRLGYFVRWPLDPDAQNYINWGTTQNSIIIPRLWGMMTTQRWFAFYPEVFRVAMRKAQIAEADQVLFGDVIRQKRNDGIISEKVGESSFMFRARKPLNLGISPEALAYLTGFVDLRNVISRA